MDSFKYGKPVTGALFVNREEELGELMNLMVGIRNKEEMNVALIGPRRCGKTSLLKNLELGLKKERDIIPVFFDCFGIPSQATFAKLLLETIKDSYIEKMGDLGYGKRIAANLKRKTSEILSRISEMEVSMADYISIRIALQEGSSDGLWERVLDYAEKLAKGKGLFFVIILDKFPDIGIRWKEDFIKRFRTKIQHQERVAYIISGSAVSYMIDLVENRRSPLYRQLKVVKVKEMPEDIVKSFVSKRLNIDKGPLKRFIELSGLYPDYMQRLGHILQSRHGKSQITRAKVETAYQDMLLELEIEFSDTLERLNYRSSVYGDMILSLADNETPSKLAASLGIPLGSVPKYLNHLIDTGIAHKVGRGRYALSDPVFKDWVLRRFSPLYGE